MTNWSELWDAYGSAREIPILLAADDGAEAFTEISRQYSTELTALRDLAEQALPMAQSSSSMRCRALLAFEGTRASQYRLEALADEELELTCPQCREQLSLSLTATPPPIIAATPDTLDDGAPTHMYQLAVHHRRADVAAGILYLLGETTCPACARRFVIPHALA